MASKKVFLIGIGGTGMRCLEAFVHTCAIGMYDNTEVHMLALDTDKGNGNFGRLRELQNDYCLLNGDKEGGRQDTFFSARLKFYQFCPAYSGETFAKQTGYGNNTIDGAKPVSDELIDLFMDKAVLNMNLEHGYRAQTQMGSVLMYYAIQKAAYEAKRGTRHQDFKNFMQELASGSHNPVFVFGSVFGGTGASSIPIIAQALDKAAETLGHNSITANNYFGTILLTNYFRFETPNVKPGEVVAKSDNFAINSQAALMFYNEDNTVKNFYKRMYLLGRDSSSLRNVTEGNTNVDTGGEKQKNPADFIEFMAAMAAYDFVKACGQNDPFKQEDQKFFCIAHNYENGLLDFPLFAQDAADTLKKKMGIALAASLLSLDPDSPTQGVLYNFFVNVSQKDSRSGRMTDIDVYGTEMKALKHYFELFGFSVDKDGNLVRGWLPQMYAARKLLFAPDLFSRATFKELKSFKMNTDLYAGDGRPEFSVPGGLRSWASTYADRTLDVVKKAFDGTKTDRSSNIYDLLERTYATLMKLYFNEE
jgi:hypothetical protein